MTIEHDELHADLVKATKAGGQAGEAAKAVAKVLHNHFHKEEEYALPPLGLGHRVGRLGPGPDHPVLLGHVEGEYLTGLLLRDLA